MAQKLLVIVNTKAGVEDAFPEQMKARLELDKQEFIWAPVATPIDAREVVRKHGSQASGIIVYGGDGTIIGTVKAAHRLEVPLLLLAGGTANAFVADLNLPTSPMESLELFLSNHYVLRHVDVARVNGRPFLLDLHFGSWADAITTTPRGQKRRFGKLAYALSAARQLAKARPNRYRLMIDGENIDVRAYVLLVANSGDHQVLGARLFNSPNGRGMVKVALVKKIDQASLLKWYFRRRFSSKGDRRVITTYNAREVVIKQAPKNMIFDDDEKTAKLPLKISARPEAAMLVVPLPAPGWSLHRIELWLQLLWYRLTDRWHRSRLGIPNLQTSLVAPGIFLGGQYDKRVEALFKQWNVTGIINMRKQRRPLQFENIELLHLPTQDWRAPTLSALREGVEFIQKTQKSGGAIYIHCRAGEGRGPTMAAAYFIAQGMRTHDALAHLQRFRPYARPSKEQRRQLTRFEELVRADKSDRSF